MKFEGICVVDKLATAGIVDAIIDCFGEYYGIKMMREDFSVWVETSQTEDVERVEIVVVSSNKLEYYDGKINFLVDSTFTMETYGEPLQLTIEQANVIAAIVSDQEPA